MADKPKNTVFQSKREKNASGFSIWERRAWLEGMDAVVVGAGIVGMSTALALKDCHPDWRILVMDRSPFGGGSTRNAGFACFGSPSELLEDWLTLGTQTTLDLVRMRWEGLASLRAAWGDEAIGFKPCGSVEAFTDGSLFESCATTLPELNEGLADLFGQAPFSLSVPAKHGLRNLVGAIASPLEGAISTDLLIRTMRRQLEHRNIVTLLGLELQGMERDSSGWLLHTAGGSFHSPRVALATNAFSRQWLDLDVQPIDNHVVVTEALPRLKMTQTMHHDRGYVYARQVGDQLMIGGGRQWNLEGPEATQDSLIEWARRHIEGAEDATIRQAWTGQLGIGNNRWPIVEKVDEGLWCAVRMGGMGVAIGHGIGKKLAEMM